MGGFHEGLCIQIDFHWSLQPWTKAYFVFLSIFPLIPVLPPLLSISHSRFPLSQWVSVPLSLSIHLSCYACVYVNVMQCDWGEGGPILGFLAVC